MVRKSNVFLLTAFIDARSWCLETSQLSKSVKNGAIGRCLAVIPCAVRRSVSFRLLARRYNVSVRLLQVVRSTDSGNAKASRRGTNNGIGSRAVYF